VLAAIALLFLQATVIASLGQHKLAPLLSDLLQLGLGITCIASCGNAFHRSRGVARYVWRFFALTFIVWCLGQSLAVYIDISGNGALEGADEVIFFLSVVPFGMLPFLDPEDEPNVFDRLHILDFVQVCVFWFSIFLCFSPRLWSPASGYTIGPFLWSRNIAFDALLGLTFVFRAVLTRSRPVRQFFTRMFIFLMLSGLADSYALSPKSNLQPGGWFDLIWAALLLIPILIATTWKGDAKRKSVRSHSVLVDEVFPLFCPLVSFLILAHVSGSYPALSLLLFAVSFVAFSVRVLIIQYRQQRAEEKYRAIFEDAVVGIFQAKANGEFLSVNRALAHIFGYDSGEELIAEVSNLSGALFVHHTRIEELKRVLDDHGVVHNAELEVYRRDRVTKWVVANLRAVCDRNGKMVFIEGTIEDITDRKRAEGRVQFLAYYDALTGLANRTLLQDRLLKALASARRRNERIALLFLDLDRFKLINDSLGHSFGDLLLKEVAQRLKLWARDQDTVARIGGDEFLMVINGLEDVEGAAVAAERLMDDMTREFIIQEQKFHISCSVGICIFPEHGSDTEVLIKNADAAMYSAKESGRNTFRFFSDEMNAQVVERLAIEHGLREALENSQFFLVYQPQIEIETGKVVGFEALLRWHHPKLGMVPPAKFIRVAENSGLIVPIGEWVLKTACSVARRWQLEGLFSVPVAVNVSAVQFRHKGFHELVHLVLQETGLEPKYLELELTEGLLISNAEVMLDLLGSLKAMGIKLAIDDFGTGYSSLSYLRQFPVSKIKIDRSFIRDLATNPDDAAISKAVISMAKGLNLRVIAEGVENDAQMEFLRVHKCDEVQGYIISKPLTAAEIAVEIQNQHRAFSAFGGG
jgi:diguanylate cyclase (GGDEF)-like protein/PAS domain S-box-containing protein